MAYHETRPKPWREPVDRVPSDDIPSLEVQRLILAEIDEHGDRRKWQLRETLGINDQRLLKELTILRKIGMIYASGGTSDRVWKRQ